MKKIFVSYRRDDTPFATGWLCERLKDHFGSDKVFVDVDNIPLAANFRQYIQDALHDCDVVLAMIGDRWLATADSGKSRIHDQSDWVRVEIDAAFSEQIPCLPVLVNGASIPNEKQLPDTLSELPDINAATLRSGNSFDHDIAKLIEGIEKLPSRDSVAPVEVGPEIDDLESGTTSSKNELAEMVVRFLSLYDRWYFNAPRIHQWGGNKADFRVFRNYSVDEIRQTLNQLVIDGKLASRISKKGSTVFKIR
ncbi:MAG: toll/interleukin-1 receptor domain-containing protein [Pirellulaceae bacterium]|jgi:hypothetical protein|nr:hypothetical protein [Planctomycetaceae bacterium]MDP6558088.1 toll/interleukin-1 receptor domain-containing protein [Pirellulaceae bacterium]